MCCDCFVYLFFGMYVLVLLEGFCVFNGWFVYLGVGENFKSVFIDGEVVFGCFVGC